MAEENQQPGAANGEANTVAAPLNKPRTAGQMESIYYSVIGRMGADGRIMVGQDIEIFPGRERPDIASPGTKAYEAKDRRLTTEQFALLCGRSGIPRVTMIGSYKNLRNTNIVKLLDAGIIDWAPEKRQRFALIFEKPLGKKILETPESHPAAIPEEKLVPSVIRPVLSLLSDMKNVDLVHGSINIGNAYMTGAAGSETIVVGECLSSSPFMWQSPMYESITRSMAKPSGRGTGSIKDDLYALGVCVSMLARGENLLLGKTPEQIIAEKLESGSYGAIVGRDRVPGGVAEFLRGVLNDDENQRWDIDDANRWLEGRRLTPKPPPRGASKAARPLVFKEKQHWDLRSAAYAFSQDIPAAAVAVGQTDFEQWVRRSFDDKSLLARIEKVWEREKSSPPERIVSFICMAMDPFAPARYKNMSLFPSGLGTALAEAITRNENIPIYGELLVQQILNNWVSQIFEELPDAAGVLAMLEKCRNALSQKMPGYGLERVLYLLNNEVSCLSPMLKDFFVLMPGSLLLALEEISKRPDRPETMLDRHMIAFISVREPKMIDPHMGYVNSSDLGTRIIGILRTLAYIQRRFSIGPVPGVGNWLISMTPPVIDMLNDRDLRNEMTRRVNRLTDTGNLVALLELMDNSITIQNDAYYYALARQEYGSLVQEKEEIEGYLKKRKYFGQATGRQVAMIFSSLLSVIVVCGYLVLHFLKGLL